MAIGKNMKIEHSYFHSLELKGVGCFKDKQSLDLSDGNSNYSKWTLILGDNGTGKTTLLKVLDRFQPVRFDFNNQNVFYLPADSQGSIDFFINHANLKIVNNYIINSIAIEGAGAWSEYKLENTNVFLISYGASRRMSKINNLSRINDNDLTTLFDYSIELINAEEWYFQKFLKLQTSDKKIAKVFQNQLTIIKNLLIDFLPDVIDIRPKEINDINQSSTLEVLNENGEWISLRDLSYGYQTMTALLVDIGSRMMNKYPESDHPLAEPAIILIDEIDLHLHPKWQRQIIEQFSSYFPNAQFIVTSHSPLIVQAAKDVNANIVVCRKEGDHVVIDNDPEEVKGWRIDQILISDLFDSPTVRSKKDAEILDKYYTLKAKSKLTKKEELEVRELSQYLKKSFESDEPISETERKINQFLETHLK